MPAATQNPRTVAPKIVGRQPIFDRRKGAFAYRLTYWSGAGAPHTPDDGVESKSQGSDFSQIAAELAGLTGQKKALLKISRDELIAAAYAALPAASCILELSEVVEPDDEVLAACRALRDAGYLLALDEYALLPHYAPLFRLANIVAVDFLASSAENLKAIAERHARSVALLAKKVERYEDFEEALRLGYTHFQGYFFCKPHGGAHADIPAFKQNYLRFIKAASADKLNFDELEDLIKHDMSLSTTMLRYLNSSSIGIGQRITSIKQALTLLGEEPLRRWASLVALAALGEDKPSELVVTALVRARFCEMLAPSIGLAGRELDLFLMGLLSAIDALTDRPLSEVITQIPLPHDVTAALLGANNTLARAYSLAQAFERGIPARLTAVLAQLKLALEPASEIYKQAVTWADANLAQ